MGLKQDSNFSSNTLLNLVYNTGQFSNMKQIQFHRILSKLPNNIYSNEI